jgi:MFS family permease
LRRIGAAGARSVTLVPLRSRRSVVVSTLGVTQTLAWGSTYYLPAVFADPLSRALNLPREWFFGIFSVSLLLSGLLGPLAGRMIDRYGGRDVLVATNFAFAVGLTAMASAAGSVGLIVAWTILGIGMGFGLYEAAFATVAGLYGRDARNAITGITLFAGFASTVGWPTSAIFIDVLGWRGACLAWAALHLLIGVPMNRLLVPKTPPHMPEVVHPAAAPSAVPWTMIVLAGVFGACWSVSTAMAAHLPRLLQAMGVSATAAIAAASLVGPAQVAARLVEFSLLRRMSPMISARLATGLHPMGAALLAFFGPIAAIPFVLLHGAGNGMLTIARGTLPLALYGPAGYGLRTGILSAPARILQGGAPLLFGIVLDGAGPRAALLLSGMLAGASFVALLSLSAVSREEPVTIVAGGVGTDKAATSKDSQS